jgi:hypothetical protein
MATTLRVLETTDERPATGSGSPRARWHEGHTTSSTSARDCSFRLNAGQGGRSPARDRRGTAISPTSRAGW